MSLSIKGGSIVRNRIITGGGAAEVKCPFSVMAYESAEPGKYKAFIEDGEINFTKYYEKNNPVGAPGAEIDVVPNSEIGLCVVFNNANYEYKNIKEINVVTMDASKPEDFATMVADQTDGTWDITTYIPLAYIYNENGTDPAAPVTISVRQYWCGNTDFRTYFTAINGKLCFEFFRTLGLTPGAIDPS
jgi:hypothetical protein